VVELLLVSLLAAGLYALPPSAYAIVLALGIATGMPHGATDLITERGGVSRPALIYYALGIALLGGLWMMAPSWALAAFLVLSMVHFCS
jgi:hypothetical protein